MNETRKKIIELIKPCMKSTFSEVSNGEDKIRFIVSKQFQNPETGEIAISEYPIVKFYNIDAVCKYIEHKKLNTPLPPCDTYLRNISHKFIIRHREDNIGMLPLGDKPLHLYSEQEEKDLLVLLNNINKNDSKSI